MSVNDKWQLWSGEISKEYCESFVKELSKLPPQEATTFNGDSDYRSSIVRWASHEESIACLFESYFLKANGNAFAVELGRTQDIEIQFTEYDSKYQGQYKVHHDIDWNGTKPYQRKLSMVVQLSDPADYEGGELQFTEVTNPDKEALQKQGSIIVFPSYLQHAVTPVTKGKRYSLVLWLSGPRWK